MFSGQQRILCYSPNNFWRLHGMWELTILQGLKARGADVKLVMCDAQYKECDIFWDSNARRSSLSCTVCQARTSELASSMAMNFQWLGRYTTLENARIAEEWSQSLERDQLMTATYQDWPIGEWVRSSVHSSFRASRLDLTQPRVEEVYRNYVYSGLIACFGLTALLHDYKPDKMLLFNGRQSSTRVALELARRNNIRVICHERGIVTETLQLFENDYVLALTPFEKLWNDWGPVALSTRELEATRTHLKERELGKKLGWTAFSPPPQDISTLCEELQLENNKPIWVLFTSSDDEVVSHKQFRGPLGHFDWVLQTVDYAKNHPEIQLIIRVHPNTKGNKAVGNNEVQAAAFEELGKKLPPNVRMVGPEAAVSSYTLMDSATVGLVYSSFAGLEMACKAKQVIVAGGCYISNLPFVRKVETSGSYLTILEEARALPIRHTNLDTGRLAYRFAHAFFFRWNIPFPLVKMPTTTTGELAYKALTDLEPGKDASLDRICRILLENDPVVIPPSLQYKVRSSNTETAWLRKEFNYSEDDLNEPTPTKENNAA